MTEITSCPCGSGRAYADCCQPLHQGSTHGDTPEQVMRARYAAFVTQDIDFLENTLLPGTRDDFDREHVAQWAGNSEWLGLEVKGTEDGADADEGFVEFVARFALNGQPHAHHETSRFRKQDGRWYYVDGSTGPRTVRKGPKVGRNDPCPCGSGKKYKKCCGAAA